MNDHMGKIWSLLDSDEISETTHDHVAEHPGHEVCSFDQLTRAVAHLNFYNPNLNLYFRGQTKDHKIERTRKKGKTVLQTALLPGAFRENVSSDKASSRKYLACPPQTVTYMSSACRIYMGVSHSSVTKAS